MLISISIKFASIHSVREFVSTDMIADAAFAKETLVTREALPAELPVALSDRDREIHAFKEFSASFAKPFKPSGEIIDRAVPAEDNKGRQLVWSPDPTSKYHNLDAPKHQLSDRSIEQAITFSCENPDPQR